MSHIIRIPDDMWEFFKTEGKKDRRDVTTFILVTLDDYKNRALAKIEAAQRAAKASEAAVSESKPRGLRRQMPDK